MLNRVLKLDSVDFIRFLLVGICSNVINFLIFTLTHLTKLPVLLCAMSGYASGLVFSYHFARVWVFRHKLKSNNEKMLKFLLVYITGGALMSVSVELFAKYFAFDLALSWCAGAFLALTNKYFGSKFLVVK